jgi:hydrogenase/urease accessory protein HupE
MDSTYRYARYLLRFSIVACLLCLFPVSVHAHDPGLSSLAVTVSDREIDVLVGFAERDANAMLAFDAGVGETRKTISFQTVKPALESVVTKGVSLYFGEQVAQPIEARARQADNQNVEILIRFERAKASQVRLVSRLIGRLPFGHRQFLSARTIEGTNLGEVLLSSENSSFQFNLPATAASPTAQQDHSFLAFLGLGIEHILSGYDHLLFLFALLVVCRNLRSILTVITCFTIAHSITLALATLDIVRLPGRVVEPLIAVSIAYVGIENLIRGDAPKWRWLITFSFGLIHGLGFADALREFGIRSAGFGVVIPLVGFNLGVEIGQLSVAAVILPILWQLRKHPVFVRRWVPACSIAIALAGSYWMVERMFQS